MRTSAYSNGFESLSEFNDDFRRFSGDSPGRSRSLTPVQVTRLLTPLGPMVVAATDEELCLLEFSERPRLETQIKRLRARLDCAVSPGRNAVLRQTEQELEAYFGGGLTTFSLPLLLKGTPFQTEVWKALLEVPFGSTASYGELAVAIGNPQAVRAVGKANGDNPLAIVVPCHRIIGTDGKLTGYGGGLWRKKALLELESGQQSLLPSV